MARVKDEGFVYGNRDPKSTAYFSEHQSRDNFGNFRSQVSWIHDIHFVLHYQNDVLANF